ncbi:MAG: hypothetical protein DRJ03_24450 [Chloroflexi bacterium]|nr:MAG: hypothetical protein DRJ03_24450 [Chloroflexota bacterium]
MGINPTVRYYSQHAFTTFFGQRIRLIRLFQEAMSEIMMGRFISHYGRSKWVKTRLTSRVLNIINAYTHFLTIPCLLCFFGPEIARNRMLDKYFSQFKGYRRWKIAWERGTLPEPTITTWFEFFMALGYKLGFEYLLGKIGSLVLMPSLYLQLLFEQFPEGSLEEWANPWVVINFINQKFGRSDFDLGLTTIPQWLWYPINPFIWLDWAVLKSYIMLAEVYKLLDEAEDEENYVPPYIPGQPVKVDVNNQFFKYLEIGEDGICLVKIPKQLQPKQVILDTLNLKVKAEWKPPRPPIQLTPIADAFISQANPDTNYGSWSSLILWQGCYPNFYDYREAWLLFDLSDLPEGLTIKKATLKLHLDSISSVLQGHTQYVNFGYTDFDEYAITFNNRPKWEGVGGSSFKLGSPGYYTIDVTSYLVECLEKGKRFGVRIPAPDSIAFLYCASVAYCSREGSNPPILEIEFGEQWIISPE